MNKKLLDLLEKDFKGSKGVIKSISDPIPTPTAYLKCNRNTRVTVNADTEFNYYYNRLVADGANFASPIKIDQSAIAIDAFYAANKTSFPAKEAALLEVSNGDEYVDIVFDPAEPVWVGPLHLGVIRKVRTAYDHLVMGKYPIVSIKSRMTSPDADGHIKHQYQYGQTQYDQCARDLYFSSGHNERVGTLGEPLVLGTDNSIVIDPATDPTNIAMVPRLLINNPSTAEFYTATSKHTVYHWLSYTGHADNEVMTIDLGGDFNTFIYLDHVNNGVYIQPASSKIYINTAPVGGIVQGRAILLALELRMSSGTDYEAGIWINGVYIGAAPLGVVAASDWLSYTISGASSAPAQLRFDYLTVLDKALTDAEHLALYQGGKIPVAGVPAFPLYDYVMSLNPLGAVFADAQFTDETLVSQNGPVTITLRDSNGDEFTGPPTVAKVTNPMFAGAIKSMECSWTTPGFELKHITENYFARKSFTVCMWVHYSQLAYTTRHFTYLNNTIPHTSFMPWGVQQAYDNRSVDAPEANNGRPLLITNTLKYIDGEGWGYELRLNGVLKLDRGTWVHFDSVTQEMPDVIGSILCPKFNHETSEEFSVDGIVFFDRELTSAEHAELADTKYINPARLAG